MSGSAGQGLAIRESRISRSRKECIEQGGGDTIPPRICRIEIASLEVGRDRAASSQAKSAAPAVLWLVRSCFGEPNLSHCPRGHCLSSDPLS